MRSILINLLQLGGMQLVMAFTAIVRNKVLALRLGAEGYGEFSQLSLLALASSVFVAFGLGLSLNRNVAATTDVSARQRYLAQANTINLSLSALLLTAALVILIAQPALLGMAGLPPRPEVRMAGLLLLLFIPLEAAMQHRVGFLTGMMDVRGLTGRRSLALLIGTAVSVPLVWWFGLVGATTQLVILAVTNVVFLDRRCRSLGIRPWALVWDTFVLRYLAGFGLASLMAGFAQQTVDVVVRSSLIRTVDAAQNGIYQAALSITHQVKAVVLGSVGSYAIATLSQDTSKENMTAVANRLLRAVLPIAAVALGGLGLLSGPVILILYVRDFLPAQSVLPYLLTSEFLNVVSWVCGAPLLASRWVRTWLAMELVYAAVRAASALWLLPLLGTTGVAVAYLIATALHMTITVGVFLLVLRLRLEVMPVVLFSLGLAMVVGLSILGAGVVFDWGRYLLGAAAILAFSALTVHWLVGWGRAWQVLIRGFRGMAS